MSSAPGPVVLGVLLAAGGGRRFGQPKALVTFRGEPLVLRGLRTLADGGCTRALAVLGARADEVAARLGRLVDAPYAVAEDWESGMAASLRAGLEAAGRSDAAAVVIALADQPLVGAAAVARLIAAHAAGAEAAIATYDGQPRNPVLLARAVWPDVLASATGDVGARPWLRAHPEIVVPVDCTGTGLPDDADTPEQLARLAAL